MSQTPMVAVTGSQRPYVYDLPHFLSLPRGFEFRFRYFVDWISAEIRSEFDLKRRSPFAGRDLILVYHSQDTRRLLPVRRGEVIDLERRGPFYFLRFIVGDFVPVSRDVIDAGARDEARKRESAWLEEHGRSMVGLGEVDLSQPLPKGAHLSSCGELSPLFKAIRPGGVPDDADGKWACVAALLMAEPSLESMPMFFLQGFVSRQGTLRDTTDMENSFSSGGRSGRGFEIVSGERYRLRLIQWMGVTKEMRSATAGPSPASYRVVCQVDRDALHLEGQSDLVVGKYDILEYTIKARTRGYSELTLGVEESHLDVPGHGEGSKKWHEPWPQLYSVRVPVRVRHNRARLFINAASAISGLALFLAPELEIVSTLFTPSRAALSQLVGLALLFASYGSVLSGYVDFAQQGRGLSRSVSNS